MTHGVLRHGLLKSSFVPASIRGLRDWTRYRANLAQECHRIANRIQKVWEDPTSSWPRWRRTRSGYRDGPC
jgi:hypothetical protein